MSVNFVLIAHVLAALLLLGPVTVAISMFPKLAMSAQGGEPGTIGAARTMHSITRTYGMISLLVPGLGVGVMFTDMGLYGTDPFVHTSILLAVIAWAILFFAIIPQQRTMLAGLGVADEDEDIDDPEFQARAKKARSGDWGPMKTKLTALSGVFSLIWVIMAILMFFI